MPKCPPEGPSATRSSGTGCRVRSLPVFPSITEMNWSAGESAVTFAPSAKVVPSAVCTSTSALPSPSRSYTVTLSSLR